MLRTVLELGPDFEDGRLSDQVCGYQALFVYGSERVDVACVVDG
jgi:hypothetical protein